jgi:hypothetical protein
VHGPLTRKDLASDTIVRIDLATQLGAAAHSLYLAYFGLNWARSIVDLRATVKRADLAKDSKSSQRSCAASARSRIILSRPASSDGAIVGI